MRIAEFARMFRVVIAELLLAMIVGYRLVLSPLFGGRCRFEPSCSEYAAASIEHHGPWRGVLRALVRLGKCHPFHPGGYDPPVREP